jgi:hypothetical protein
MKTDHVNEQFHPRRLRLLGVSVAVERDEVVAMVANVCINTLVSRAFSEVRLWPKTTSTEYGVWTRILAASRLVRLIDAMVGFRGGAIN